MSRLESRPVRYPTLNEAARYCTSHNNREIMEIIARGKMVNNAMTIKNGKLYYKAGKNRKSVMYEIDINMPYEIVAQQFEALMREVIDVAQQRSVTIDMEFATTVSPAVCRKRLMDYYRDRCINSGMTTEQMSTSLDNIGVAFDVGVITQDNIVMINGVVQGVDNVYLDPNTGVLFAYSQPQRTPLQPVQQNECKQMVIKDTSKLEQTIADRTTAVLLNINAAVVKTSGVTPYHSVVVPITGR